MQKHRVSALQPLIRVVDGAGAPYFSTLLLGSGSRLQFYDSYLDSFSADIPPFPVVESYDSGDVKGGGHIAPSFTPFQSSSLTELWLLSDRSTPVSSTVDVQRYGVPGALRPSSSRTAAFPVLQDYAMVAERPEYYYRHSLTTVDVHGHAVLGLCALPVPQSYGW